MLRVLEGAEVSPVIKRQARAARRWGAETTLQGTWNSTSTASFISAELFINSYIHQLVKHCGDDGPSSHILGLLQPHFTAMTRSDNQLQGRT